MPANLSLAKAFVDLSLKGGDAVIAGITKIKNSITTTLAPLANAFQPAQQAVLGFVGAASPQAFNTFQGSLKLLSATIGQAFIPYVIQASRWIQSIADAIRNMDPETKKNIASWISYGLIIAGAAAAFMKLSSVMDVIAKHPVAATFLLISAAIMKVNADMDAMQAKMNKSIETMQRMQKGVYTEGEFKQSAAGAIAEDDSMSNEEKLKKAEEIRKKLAAEARATAKEGYNQSYVDSTIDYGKGAFGQANKTDEMQYTIQRRMKEVGMLDDYIAKLKSGDKVKFTKAEDIAKGGSGGGSGLAMAGNGMGGQVSSLENAFMQTASAALAADDLQQKMLQMQMEGNAISTQAAADIKRVADATERAQQP